MGRLIKELAGQITLEQKVAFALLKGESFQTRLLGIDEVSLSNLTEDQKLESIKSKLQEISGEELFALVTPDMVKEHYQKEMTGKLDK